MRAAGGAQLEAPHRQGGEEGQGPQIAKRAERARDRNLRQGRHCPAKSGQEAEGAVERPEPEERAGRSEVGC